MSSGVCLSETCHAEKDVMSCHERGTKKNNASLHAVIKSLSFRRNSENV